MPNRPLCSPAVAANHSNKHVREAIAYAESRGWRFVKGGGHAHPFGKLLCPANTRGGCIANVHSTPRNPQSHARTIRAAIDACPHARPASQNPTS